ncbi:MAG: hypothetical protein WAX07_06855 [Candidatus Altiarchaeia archaeon]
MKDKGISSLFDVMIYAIILVMAFAAIQIYSVSHQSASIKNIGYEAENRYAAQTLDALSYLTIDGDGYETVQAGTIENVEDKDLKKLSDAGKLLRELTGNLDATLDGWSDNSSKLKEDLTRVKTSIELARQILTTTKYYVDKTSKEIQKLPAKCDEILDVNVYGQIIGGININDSDPCAQVDALTSRVTNASAGVIEQIDTSDNALQDIITKIDSYSEDQMLLDRIQQTRCLLREVNVKLDHYISYAELGVKENATLIDLLPVRADLRTAPLTMMAGESLYVEDRLVQSDYLRAGGAIAAIIGMQYLNTSEETETEPETYAVQGNTSTLLINASVCSFCINCLECNATTKECTGCGACITCENTYPVSDLYTLFNWSEHTVEITNTNTFEACENCTGCGSIGCNECTRCADKYEMNDTQTITGNQTQNNTNKTTEDSKSRIIQAVILTLGRKDFRDITKEQVKKALDAYLEGYTYCFKAKTCCDTNQITLGNCTKIPDNAGHARKKLLVYDSQNALLDLYIWRG